MDHNRRRCQQRSANLVSPSNQIAWLTTNSRFVFLQASGKNRISPGSGTVASFPGTAEQSELPYFLPCAGAGLDFERGGESVGGRELLTGGRKPDAGGARRRIGDMLDRVCTDLARNARGKSRAESSGKPCTGCSDHRRASEIRSPAGSQKRAGHSLGRPVSVSKLGSGAHSDILSIGAYEDFCSCRTIRRPL
jgi:hypothetical protein